MSQPGETKEELRLRTHSSVLKRICLMLSPPVSAFDTSVANMRGLDSHALNLTPFLRPAGLPARGREARVRHGDFQRRE